MITGVTISATKLNALLKTNLIGTLQIVYCLLQLFNKDDTIINENSGNIKKAILTFFNHQI